MKNTIKLDNPVQINGKSYDELTYDISEITAQAFAEADARKLSASGSKNGNAAGAAELYYGQIDDRMHRFSVCHVRHLLLMCGFLKLAVGAAVGGIAVATGKAVVEAGNRRQDRGDDLHEWREERLHEVEKRREQSAH